MKPWYEMSIGERIEKVYSQYSIRDFFEWWSSKQHKVMEVRITDFAIIREVAFKYHLPFSVSGVYARNSIELKNVIRDVRDRATMWCGINPRTRSFNRAGKKFFGGTDQNVEEVGFIFVDIDRIVKNGEATNEELGRCDILCNKILNILGSKGWANSYAKICTGNGLQLLIKLDYPIKMPNIEYKKTTDGEIYPVFNEEFEKTKKLLKNGVGHQLQKFSGKFKDELGVEVDKTCWNIGRVGALPCTKNYKYDRFTWRGLIELKEGINEGITDYIFSQYEEQKAYNANPIFGKPKKEHKILKVGKLRENELIKFMLKNMFPSGGINNVLWMQVKCLLRDSKIDVHSKEWKEIHEELKHKHSRTFTMNLPASNYEFSEDITNHYCIENMIPPLYPLWKTSRPLIKNMCLDGLSPAHLIRVREGVTKLAEETTYWEDMELCKRELKEGDYNNIDKVIFFTRGLIDKFGLNRATYLLTYVLKDYFQRSSR